MKRLLLSLVALVSNICCFAELLPNVVIEKTLALGETMSISPPSDLREIYGSKLINLYGDCLSWWVNGKKGNQEVFTVETTKKSGQYDIYPYSYYKYELTAKQGGDHTFKTILCYRWKESGTNYVIQDITITYKIHVPYVHNIEMPSSMSIHVGETIKINATVTDSDAKYKLKWSSDNQNVATVTSDGTVEGVSDGTATIKCTANDGVFATFASCVVTVSSIKVTNITLPSTGITLNKGETYDLVPTIMPSNATNKQIVWSTSNSAVVTISPFSMQTSSVDISAVFIPIVSLSTINAIGEGTAVVTGTAADGSGVTVKLNVMVKDNPVTNITLPSSSITVNKGDTYQLTPTIVPDNASNKEVTWSSSNTTVATVNSSGLVTAISQGSTTITCTAKDESGVKATCQVIVSPILVSSITLNYSSYTIDDSNTLQLKATMAPSNADNKNVTWTSSNTSVATVNSKGLVTAQGKGTATITCTAKDGSGVKTTCKVTVNGVYVKSLSLDCVSCTIEEGCKTQLHAIIQPSNTTYYSLTWQSSNTSVATVDNTGCVTAVSVGTATITCKLYMSESSFFAAPYEKIATCSITVTKKEITPTTIDFADAEVKRICVENWDADGDGELSYSEAAAVMDLGTAFKNNLTIKTFEELRFFKGLVSICEDAFYNCKSMTSINLPDSVSIIGNTAFRNCNNLTAIAIPNSVSTIGGSVFMGCAALTSIEIPYSVTSIGYNPFRSCSKLVSIIVDSRNTYYDSRDNCNGIIKTSSNQLVSGCKSTVIPNSVTSIGGSAFYGCTGLTSIIIPNSVKRISGSLAFRGCTGLTSINIPSSVTSIGSATFQDCDSLKSVMMNVSIPLTFGENVFSNLAKASLYVPYGSKGSYMVADYWKEFKHIYEAGDVNKDDEIDVADVVGIARGIVGMQNDGYVEFLADFNADDEVDVRDAVALVNEIAGDVAFAKGANVGGLVASGNAVPTLSAHFVDGTVSLLMGAASTYTAFQFDIHVDDGVDVESVLLNERRGNGHTLLYNKMGEGWYRVAVVSIANNPLRGTDGELVSFTLSDRYADDIVIDNIRFVTVQGDSHQLDGIDVAELTGVQSFAQDGAHEADGTAAYTLNGIRVKMTGKGIYVKNGKKIVVK